MLDWLEAVGKAVGMDPALQGPLALLLLGVVVVWQVYRNVSAQIQLDRDRLRETYTCLYAPALGLLKARGSGKLSTQPFQEKFMDLLVSGRAKASTPVREAMDLWLDGEQNEDILEYLVNEACQKALARIGDNRTLPIGEAVWWISDIYYNTFRSAIALLLFLGGAAGLGVILARSSTAVQWSLGIGGAILPAVWRHVLERRRQKYLAKGVEKIRESRRARHSTTSTAVEQTR